MFRFAKPDGGSFDCDYEGPIHAFDSGNDLIAICRGSEVIDLPECGCGDEDCEICMPFEICGDPLCATDWEIVVYTEDEEATYLVMKAIALAYAAVEFCEHMVQAKCPEED